MAMFHRRSKTEDGVMAVEFALVFPILFVVLFAIVQYGLYFWGRSTVAASAREAARRMAVGTEWTCTESEALAKSGAASSADAASYRYLNSANAAVIGDLVEVTVTARTLAPRLFPLPDGGQITEVASARVENIPISPIGCS